MTVFLKGPMCSTVVFAFLCFGNAFAGFYDEVKLRAKQGDPEAQDVLSYMYRTGKGVPKNLDQARRWESLAARGGLSKPRMSPQRPQSRYRVESSFASPYEPRQVRLNTVSYQGIRMEPRRPVNASRQVGVRSLPRRPSSGTIHLASSRLSRYSQYRMIERGIQRYDKGQKWGRRLSRGSRLIASPVSFTLKLTKRAVSKVARKAALAKLVPY